MNRRNKVHDIASRRNKAKNVNLVCLTSSAWTLHAPMLVVIIISKIKSDLWYTATNSSKPILRVLHNKQRKPLKIQNVKLLPKMKMYCRAAVYTTSCIMCKNNHKIILTKHQMNINNSIIRTIRMIMIIMIMNKTRKWLLRGQITISTFVNELVVWWWCNSVPYPNYVKRCPSYPSSASKRYSVLRVRYIQWNYHVTCSSTSCHYPCRIRVWPW